ncbi:HIT family protein [Streptomyces sp. NPDC050509]|uniref:HIT family protein n=1 Tax=Streptomyces sp. NPDC050509 TaxID=3365620 RepID=UPI0037BD21D4
MTSPDCYTCGQEARIEELPLSERIVLDRHWRVAHAFDTALPGWLVLLPRRHVTAVHELTDAEAATLGTWQVRLSRALRDVTGCVKTYVAQFAEPSYRTPRPAVPPMSWRWVPGAAASPPSTNGSSLSTTAG